MTLNLVETLQLEVREAVMAAERLALRPLKGELKLAVDLVRALDGLDPLLQKTLDQLWEEDEGREKAEQILRSMRKG